MYSTDVSILKDVLASVDSNELKDPYYDLKSDRIILKNGLVVDPKNQLEEKTNILISGDEVIEVGLDIKEKIGDKIIDCTGLYIFPGLIDMHLHLGDLFEVSTNSIFSAVSEGVTMGLSPGAGNTFMAPALLGAEVDRGLPINIGVYEGAGSVLSTSLSVDELIMLFRGELNEKVASQKMTRNSITNTTAPLTVGIKDHMGHFIMDDDNINKIFEITSQSGLVYMTHTQDPDHALRLANLSKGRPLHLGHTTAAGCGSHKDAVWSMKEMVNLCREDNITGEFVTTMLRRGGGNRDGIVMPAKSQNIAYEALEAKEVSILVSDGQADATMKGFGDTRDNLPAIFELVDMGVLSLRDSVATMTMNPVKMLAKTTNNFWWENKLGHLGVGAFANVTIADPNTKQAVYTIVNGEIVGFANRAIRSGFSAGRFVSKFGMSKKTGVGDISMYRINR